MWQQIVRSGLSGASAAFTAISADTHIARGAQGLLGAGLWSNWPYPEGNEDGLPPAREETIKLVNDVACPSCEVMKSQSWHAPAGGGGEGARLRHPMRTGCRH